jgi:hypothetical protein
MLRAARRSPGIRFEAEPPRLDEVLPRMDIAVLVGFAASGPVDVPVAVESAAAFEDIFGGAAPLAWDAELGVTTTTQLAPAVRAFFRGGGARCWIVRLADAAAFNYFPLTGLVRSTSRGIAPAYARSRAAGSWSDAHRVSAAITPAPLDVVRFTRTDGEATVELGPSSAGLVAAGDLLRVELGTRYVVFVAVDTAVPILTSPPARRPGLEATGQAIWFRTSVPTSDPSAIGTATVYSATRSPADAEETFASAPVTVLNPVGTWDAAASGSVELELRLPVTDAPQPGAVVSATAGAEQLWMTVAEIGIRSVDATGIARLRLGGRGLWRVASSPAGSLPSPTRAERLSLELWVREPLGRTTRVADLGLTPRHARYWRDLPDDEHRYTPATAQDPPRRPLADAPLFPLAGAGPADAIYLPIEMLVGGERDLGAAPQPPSARERDGIAAFSPALFLDPALVASDALSLAGTAEHVRYTAQLPRRLTGLHAAFDIDEATIVAVPDAGQAGWLRSVPPAPPRPRRSPPLPPPAWGTFIDCRVRVIKPPRWAAPLQQRGPFRFDGGTFRLEWVPGQSRHAAAPLAFTVDEAHAADWSDSAPIYEGPATQLDIYGRPRGIYYFRVRATTGGRTSNWSRGLTVLVGGAEQWLTRDAQSYEPDTLLAVHRSLLRLAAARGDLFAVLGLPAHYRADEAIAHVDSLKDPHGVVIPVSTGPDAVAFNLALDAGEARAFSFGALYHPWAGVRDASGAAPLARISPDGIAAGLIAGRARARGVWVAPGNEPLPGVLALSPAMARDLRDPLLDAAVNVIVEEPRGFVPLSALTLSDDRELEQINVRRLMSLLRRLALREGATYVFEPNDAALRRTVQRGFEAILTRMFERGAFAGRTATTAFQVTTGESVNPPQQVDNGRFVVELRVAPSLPMTFLTVRLVQSGDRASVVEA